MLKHDNLSLNLHVMETNPNPNREVISLTNSKMQRVFDFRLSWIQELNAVH